MKLAVHGKVLKDNLSTFSDACILAKRIGYLDGYLGKMHSNGSYKHSKNEVYPIGYEPIDLDAAQYQYLPANNAYKFANYELCKCCK